MAHVAYRLVAICVVAPAVIWIAGTDSPKAARGTAHTDPAACAPPVVTPGGVGEGRNDALMFPATVGEVRIAMLFVEFADIRSAAEARETYESFVPGAVEWYRRVSYDRLRLEVTPLLRRVTLGGTLSHYMSGGGGGIEAGLRSALAETLTATDAEADFSRFHAIYLVLPFAALQRIGASGVLILERPVRVDGSDIRTFAVLFDDGGADFNYLAHETGHILGLPDLYVNRAPETMHRWDIMATPTPNRGLFAWHRWKLGWLDPEQIVCVGSRRRVTTALTPLERPGGRKAIILRRGRYAYVVEVRQPVPVGRRICKGGVLIYEVEFGAASNEADIRLRRARLDGDERVRCGPLSQAPYGRGRGEVARLRAWGLRFEVLAKRRDGSYRIRVARGK
jgi:M6 family metalloprotease-like protein